MNDLIVTICRENRKVKLNRGFLGLNGENLQGHIIADFTDKADFIDGNAYFEVVQNGKKYFLEMEQDATNKVYKLPIKSSLLAFACELECQIVIHQEATGDDVPVFKGEKFKVPCLEAINATEDIPEQYPSLRTEMEEAIERTNNLCDELEEKRDNGFFKGEKGDKGDAGSIKFIPVQRTDKENPIDDLPTENIDTSAIYLLPIDKANEQNRFTEYVYINGKWEVIGAITVQVDHSEYVKFTDYITATNAGLIDPNGFNKYVHSGLIIDDENHILRVRPCADGMIRDRADYHNQPVTLNKFDLALIYALTTNSLTMTDEQLKKFYAWIGAVQYYSENRNGIARFINGNLVINTPTEGAHATTKNYVDGLFAGVGGVKAGKAPQYTDQGNIAVGTAQHSYEAISKGYVDGKIAELLARIEVLESK